MPISRMVWIAYFLIEIRADTCREKQHCSDCNSTTGHCLTNCETGYYDQKCNSSCSNGCKERACTLSKTGVGNCTDGCVPGYFSISCNIPCDRPGDNCTACPGGCDGGYCQLGSFCVSGCVDSFYGTDCKNCSSGCTSCNRTTGTCALASGESLFVGLLAVSVFTVFCILVTLYVSFVKCVYAKRDDNDTEDMYHCLQRVPCTENERCK